MKRILKLDVGRCVAMTFIIAVYHLSWYLGEDMEYYLYFYPIFRVIRDSCLGLFTMISGLLIGQKYKFNSIHDILFLFGKRVLRIYPLYLIALFCLYIIDFNSLQSTLFGCLCLSPFTSLKLSTLWYIPVIMLLYIITPLIHRRSFLHSTIWLIAIITLLFFFRKAGIPVDIRLSYHLILYFIGIHYITLPPHIHLTSSFRKSRLLNLLLALMWVVAGVYIGDSYNVGMILATIGVFLLFQWSEIISETQSLLFGKIVTYISYSSFVLYLFHRLFFWLAEKFWNPASPIINVIWLLAVFIVGICVSHYVQGIYDKLIKHVRL